MAAAVKIPVGLAKTIWEQNRRLLKSLIGLVVVAAVGWIPVRALLETSSTEAVINARLITLRAPIEGQVELLAAVAAGSEVQPGAALVGIVNPRAERGRLDDLRASSTSSKAISDARRPTRRPAALHKDLVDQTRAFRAARPTNSKRASPNWGARPRAEARREEALQALARARSWSSGIGDQVS
jgi:hypothetical protein